MSADKESNAWVLLLLIARGVLLGLVITLAIILYGEQRDREKFAEFTQQCYAAGGAPIRTDNTRICVIQTITIEEKSK